MALQEDFNQIIDYAHFWNWAPDWGEVQRIYEKFPDSFSVLTPFAYSYLEELIRTTTSDYGLPLFDRNGQPVKVNVGMKLISLAIAENQNNQEYVKVLEETKKYFKYVKVNNDENGRNRVMHGFVHPRFLEQGELRTTHSSYCCSFTLLKVLIYNFALKYVWNTRL